MGFFTVSQLNRTARDILTSSFGPEIWVVGEIHGFKIHAKSSHMYFDLVEKPYEKDDQYIAKVNCAFFRGAHTRWQNSLRTQGFTSFDLKDGMEVKVKATIDLYMKEGRYQLIVSEIDPNYTLGAIEKRRIHTIERLKSMGLLDKNKALTFPYLPLGIGLITSKGSAAYNDLITILMQSRYAFKIRLFDAHMQGRRAIEEVIDGIRILSSFVDVDLIAIVRGGGARTDLFYFDDMGLCSAIANCRIPVITGIGHEIDISVADMVASKHLVTPTDAAKFLVGKIDKVSSDLGRIEAALILHARQRLASASTEVQNISHFLAVFAQRWLTHMRDTLSFYMQSINTDVIKVLFYQKSILKNLYTNIHNSSRYMLQKQKPSLVRQAMNMQRGTLAILSGVYHVIGISSSDLKHACSELIKRNRIFLGGTESLISVMDPKKVLKRGYSITLDHEGNALIASKDVKAGDILITVLYRGKITSQVKEREIV